MLKERNIYGSSRIGMNAYDKEMLFATVSTDDVRLLGRKYFEMTNHLGNVLAVVSDKKIPVSTNGTTIDHFLADLVSSGDYYPFGSPMYGRSLVREECTDNASVNVVTDLNSTFTGSTESYTALNGNTSLTVVSNALQISKSSGNAYIGASKTFNVTQTGTNHKVSFDITIPTTLGTSVLCKMDGTTVATISTTGSSFQSITLPSALSTGSHTVSFETSTSVSGSNKNFTIDNVKVFYDVTTVQTNCTQMMSIADYRYSFNGKEKDDEVKGKGNQQDYGMRIYDNRLGRFLSVDPITKNYPMLTPYQFASNRPIDGIDIDGMEWIDTDLIVSFSLWYTNLKNGTSETVSSLINNNSYNNSYVPQEVQRIQRIQQFNSGTRKIGEATKDVALFTAEIGAMLPGAETAGDAILATYHFLDGNDDDALAYAAGLMLPAVSGSALKGLKGQIHHIFTNKNFIRGQQWSKKFLPLFEKAGYSLDDAINKVHVPGHKGPHSDEYHDAVYQRLKSGTEGLNGENYKKAFDATLEELQKEVTEVGSNLNKLLKKE